MALGFLWATVCLCVFVTVLALDIMGFFSRKNHFEVDGRTVVITGGSQGMGRGLGKVLAQKGANVVLVARNKEKLAEAVQHISAAAKNPSTQRFHTISADLTIQSENTRLIHELTTWNNSQPPDIIWSNAGGAHPTLFLDTPWEVQKSQMDLNYWSHAYLAHATLQLWLRPNPNPSKQTSQAAKPRHFILTSSVAPFAPLPGYIPYTSPKAALRSFADNLRFEMNLYNGYRRAHPAEGPETDVKVHIVIPGTIISPGLENEDRVKHPVTKLLEEGDAKQTEDEVAVAAVKGLEAGGHLIATQWLGGVMRAGMLGGSPRNNWFVDTVLSWVVSIVWLFVGPDMEGKIFNWGKKNKVDLPTDS